MVIVAFLVFYTIFAFKRLTGAFLLLLFLLPSYLIRFSFFSIPMTLLEAMILILFCVWFFRNYSQVFSNIKDKLNNKNNGIREYPFSFEISLWIFLAFMSVWVANFSNSAFGIWKAYFFEPVLLYILVYNIFAISKKSKKEFVGEVILSLSVSALLVSVYAIYQKFTGTGIINPFWADEATRRVTSVFQYPNAVGLYLAPIVMMALGSLIFNFQFSIFKQFSKNKFLIFKKVVLFLSVILSVAAIYFAKSEGAIVAVAAAIMIFIANCLFQRIRKFLIQRDIILNGRIVIVSSIVSIVLFVFASSLFFLHVVPPYSRPDFGNSIMNKVHDKVTLKDFSGEVRKQQWRETYEMMSDNNRWFWGAGLGFYQSSVGRYHQEGIFFNTDRDADFRRKLVLFDDEYKVKYWRPVEIYMYPHNLLLNFWVEIGLFGMLLFAGIMLKFFMVGVKILNRENKYLVLSLILSMLVVVIHGIVDVPYFKNDLAAMFWVIVAMMGILSLKVNKVKSKKL
jgi:O-antigen ligase